MKIKIVIEMKFQLLACFLPIILSLSCFDASRPTNRHETNTENKGAVNNKPPASFTDTIKINFPSAVFYNADSLQLEKIKAVTSPAIFESTVHDCFYLMRNSRIVLKKYYPHVKMMTVENARHLLFVMAGGEKQYIDLNTKNDPCGVFIFDGKKAPRLADMTNMESELGFYFAK